MLRSAARIAPHGLFQASNPQQDATGDLPGVAAPQVFTVSGAATDWQTAVAEVDAFETPATARSHELRDLPVLIVGAERDVPDAPPIRDTMDDLHDELALRAPHATHHRIEDADHLSLLTVEEPTRAVSDLVCRFLPSTADG